MQNMLLLKTKTQALGEILWKPPVTDFWGWDAIRCDRGVKVLVLILYSIINADNCQYQWLFSSLYTETRQLNKFPGMLLFWCKLPVLQC